MKSFFILTLLVCFLGVFVLAQQNNNPDGQDYIPPVVEVDTDFYLAEGVPLKTILEAAWSKRTRGYEQGALTYYRYAVERYPNSYEAHVAQASYYSELGKSENARAAYQNAVKVASNSQEKNDAKYFLGLVEKELKWGTESTANFERAYYNYSQKNYSVAIADFLSVTTSSPQWIEAHYWLGRSYLESGQLRQARASLNRVVNSADVDSEIYKGANWLLSTINQ